MSLVKHTRSTWLYFTLNTSNVNSCFSLEYRPFVVLVRYFTLCMQHSMNGLNKCKKLTTFFSLCLCLFHPADSSVTCLLVSVVRERECGCGRPIILQTRRVKSSYYLIYARPKIDITVKLTQD